jgi:hypothetical protein
VAGLIEYNVVLDTIGYNLEIKHQNPRPTGIGLPTGVNRTIIRHNVFSKANTPIGQVQEAQPNVLVGHLPLSGEGQDDTYEIYGNFFYENPTEALFQGEGNIGLYANLFVTSSGDAINIMPHNAVPRQVTVFQNTVIAAGSGISVSGGNPNFTQRIIANAVFADTPIQGPNKVANITAPYGSAHLYVNDPYGPIGELDLYPLPGMLTGTLIDTSALTGYTDWTRDFNASVRNQAFRGAYSGEGSNPGWQLALAMKNSGAADADTDGIQDPQDNCKLVANPDQFDADNDRYGNICDADLNNSGLVTSADYQSLRSALNTTNANADLNHSGRVTSADYLILRNRLNTAPGPSGLRP